MFILQRRKSRPGHGVTYLQGQMASKLMELGNPEAVKTENRRAKG